MAREVAARSADAVRYVYMGSNTEANRYALPTSRLVHYIKARRHARRVPDGELDGRDLGHVETWSNPFVDVLRLLNRIAEEWFRQLVVWRLRRRYRVVITDRHFVLDFALEPLMGGERSGRLADRIHQWMLVNLYPKPDLVLFLDAPAELLYARKRDAPLDYLARRQQLYRRATQRLSQFRAVDAAGSLDAVVESVEGEIAHFIKTGGMNTTAQAGT